MRARDAGGIASLRSFHFRHHPSSRLGCNADVFLFSFTQLSQPAAELICVLDVPCHAIEVSPHGRTLRRIAREGTVVDRIFTTYGIKYVVDDRINGPAGSAVARTVRLVERGQAVPRLVTAYHIGGVDEGT